MPSSFATHHTKSLSSPKVLLSSSPAFSATFSTTPPRSEVKEILGSLLGFLKPPISSEQIRVTLQHLQNLERTRNEISATTADPEEDALKRAVIGNLVVGIYAEALDVYLNQASEVEAEAEWWADTARSRQNVQYYFLQTLPLRILNLTSTLNGLLRSGNLPIRPASFRQIFSSSDPLRPSPLVVALFPHLSAQPHLTAFLVSPISGKVHLFTPSFDGIATAIRSLASLTSLWLQKFSRIIDMPTELVRQECKIKHKQLEKMRDERAVILGKLLNMREPLAAALISDEQHTLTQLVLTLDEKTSLGDQVSDPLPGEGELVAMLDRLANNTLRSQNKLHATQLETRSLLRPSRMTLLWPRILLLPPLVYYAASKMYASRASMIQMVRDARETIEGFVRGWLLEPLLGVLKTVRTGGEDGIIVRKEGIAADLDSLERMTLALAQEKLNYQPEQLAELSKQIRIGDLTPVLRIYEEDIKSPLKSAVTGTLLRSVFVQVQKAKVDIDQALAGIDKLLRSQELTFAFVGVAPALSIVYFALGYLKVVWRGSRGRGQYGGKKRRTAVWSAMRRIERLLVSQPPTEGISPLTSGLLLISVNSLRSYAEESLPVRSRLREGFLEDVEDLEDPTLQRDEKMRVVERMWRCWGSALRWGQLGVHDT